jgi:predicted nuclease of predicted toxin-antitoxin system
LKLLFDHNLSPRLVSILSDLFPNSEHVFRLGMAEADDQVICSTAAVETLLRANVDLIHELGVSQEKACLTLPD